MARAPFIDWTSTHGGLAKHFSALPPKGRNQLSRAMGASRDRFYNDVIAPNLIVSPDGQLLDPEGLAMVSPPREVPEELDERCCYLPIAEAVYVDGRNQKLAIEMAGGSDPGETRPALFANPARLGRLVGHDGEECWDAPSARVVLGRCAVLTIEHDAPSDWSRAKKVEFLDDQLSWFRKSGNGESSIPIHKEGFWKALARYADFRGIVANYSGHKSVHVHLLFDTSETMERCADVRDDFRPAYISAYDRVLEVFRRCFPCEVEPDPQLRFPDTYRRLPNGVVLNTKANHILGIPVGREIPQVVVYEKLITRAPTGASLRLFDEHSLREHARRPAMKKTATTPRVSRIADMSPEEHAYCSERFNEQVAEIVAPDEYPKGAGLHADSGGWIGRLYARADDANPSTVILEDSDTAFCQGGKRPEREVRLPMSLNVLLGFWRDQYREARGERKPGWGDEEVESVSPAITRKEARDRLRQEVRAALYTSTCLLVRAPEGIGKSTCMFEFLPDLMREQIAKEVAKLPPGLHPAKTDAIRQRPAIIALNNYALAQEQCAKFNRTARRAHGIVVESFSRVYEGTCDQHGAERLTRTAAARLGCRSWLEAVEEHQPAVWQAMKTRHKKMLAPARARRNTHRIVYFVVHQSMHRWDDEGITAAWVDPAFFDVSPKERWKLIERNQPLVAVHDEVGVEHLIDMHRADKVHWVQALIRTPAWRDEWHLAERYKAFCAFRSEQEIDIKFEEALEIEQIGYASDDEVAVDEIERYAPKPGFYDNLHGNGWFVKPTEWPHRSANQVILLTTEALPVAVFNAAFERGDRLDLSELKVGGGEIELCRTQKCRTEDAVAMAKELRRLAQNPELAIISNKVTELDHTESPVAARGSDKYIGRDVGQIAHFKSPDEYEKLQVVNARFGLKTAIRLSHIDQINQIAGRNLGFRFGKENPVRHWLIIGEGLWEHLARGDLIHRERRYALREPKLANARRKDRYTGKRSRHNAARKTSEQMSEIIAEHEEMQGSCGPSDAEIDALVEDHAGTEDCDELIPDAELGPWMDAAIDRGIEEQHPYHFLQDDPRSWTVDSRIRMTDEEIEAMENPYEDEGRNAAA